MFVGSKIFLNRAAIIAVSFLVHKAYAFSQVYHKTRIQHPHLSSQRAFVQYWELQGPAAGSGSSASRDSDLHYDGKGIFDSQKFSIWSSWRKCYNLANATEFPVSVIEPKETEKK
jgi:hypothetical protein